jgi:hypothetical protein
MVDTLKNFQITAWYKVIVAIGAACLFIVLGQQRDTLAIFFGGWCLFGVGEWINHPKRVYPKGGALVTDVSRDAWWLGWIFDVISVLVIVYSVVRGIGYAPF